MPNKSNDKRNARIIQDATNAPYTVCLGKVKELKESKRLSLYLDELDKLSDINDNDERCLLCLKILPCEHIPY